MNLLLHVIAAEICFEIVILLNMRISYFRVLKGLRAGVDGAAWKKYMFSVKFGL